MYGRFINMGNFKIFSEVFFLNFKDSKNEIKKFGSGARFLSFPEMLYLNAEIRELGVLNFSEGEYWMMNEKNIPSVYWNHANVFVFKGKPQGFTNYNFDWYTAQGKKLGQNRFLIIGLDN